MYRIISKKTEESLSGFIESRGIRKIIIIILLNFAREDSKVLNSVYLNREVCLHSLEGRYIQLVFKRVAIRPALCCIWIFTKAELYFTFLVRFWAATVLKITAKFTVASLKLVLI